MGSFQKSSGGFFFFYFLAMPHGTRDLSSPIRDPTRFPQSLNHRTAREIPAEVSLKREKTEQLLYISFDSL